MLITDCGKHDLLVGFHFFTQHRILLDPANRKLIQEVCDPPSFSRTITVHPPKADDPRTQRDYQEDMERRDRRFQVQEQAPRRQILTRHNKPSQEEARGDPPQNDTNIALISGPAFHMNLKRPGSEFGYLSLAALDAILLKKRLEEHPLDDEENLRLIQERLPEEYAAFTYVFSKTASDTLAPYREGVDHKIRLTAPEDTLTCNHLYKLSEQELQAAKKYITENLNKGFITPSKDNPFAFPILFIKKADGGLWMCVDYRRLNEIT